MPDNKGNLYIHEAVALREEYNSHIKLLQELLLNTDRRDSFMSRDNDGSKKPVDDFNQNEFEEKLKKLQTKKLKLNQEIQAVNFTVKLTYEGENISIAEALEIRKSIAGDIQSAFSKAKESAFNSVIHKEERDIVEKPRYSFQKSYSEYADSIKKLRKLEGLIHKANHENCVNFKDE